MALEGNDLALLTARFGVARFGASRFGFIPCPEDVEGTGTDEPGEYIWREVQPPTTEWTLVNEDCVCRNLCTLALGEITLSDDAMDDVDVTASVALTGVLGLVSGVARINWGDGRHDQQDIDPLTDSTLEFTGHYHTAGDYTITITVWDERGCEVTQTLAVTVAASLSISAVAVQQECSPDEGDGEAAVDFTYTVLGGTAPYTYSLSWTGGGGGGPDSSEDPTVTFSGTPLESEVIPYTVMVTDDNGAEAEYDGTIEVTYCQVA